MAAVERVLVVGAGVSGMVLATALKRAGKRPDVVEIQPQWEILGVGISIQGPALRALRAIGLLDRCVQEGFGYSQVVNCDQDGNVVGIVDLPRLNGPQYPSCVGIMRPNLHRRQRHLLIRHLPAKLLSGQEMPLLKPEFKMMLILMP